MQAVLDASARSAPLGVEGVFAAMAGDDAFMEEVRLQYDAIDGLIRRGLLPVVAVRQDRALNPIRTEVPFGRPFIIWK